MVILIVEDQALLGMSLSWELQDAGHRVLGPVSSITQAEQLAAQEHPDLALIDIDLQHQDAGIELARSLQTQFCTPSLILSSEPNAVRPYTDVVLGVIAKPFNLDDIHNSVAVAQTVIQGGTPPPPAIPPVLELFARLH